MQGSKIEQLPEQTPLKVEAKKVQIPTTDKQPTTTPMSDARVRQLRDQLIRARVYQGLGPLRSNPHFIRELRARMRDVQRVLGDATKDSELPKRYPLLPFHWMLRLLPRHNLIYFQKCSMVIFDKYICPRAMQVNLHYNM